MSAPELPVVPLPAADAIAALRAASWVYTDLPDVGAPRPRGIHTRAGGFGADWRLDSAIRFVEAADEIAWVDSFLRHDLAARCDDRIVVFDVPRPEREL